MKYLRRNVIDIEVNSTKEFPKPEEAKYPITAITLWDSYTDRYYTLSYHPAAQIEKKTMGNWDIYHFNDKKQLIIKFIKLIQILDPDTYEGFFSRTFDFPYIHNYLKSFGINQNVLSPLGYATIKGVKYIISGRHTLDIKDADMKFKLRSSYSLKNIAADEKLPVQKIDVDFRTVNDNLELLDQYNKTDVEVTVKMDEKLQHIKRYVSRWQFAGLEDIDRAMSNSVVVDTVMVREAKKLGVVLPSKPEYVAKDKEDDEDDITGGLVFTPIIGIHDWVDVFDQSRFYPNLGLLLCMSPENISDNGTLVSANGTRFINNPNAFLPRIISQFFEERDKVQAEKAKLTPDHPNYWKLHDEDENIKFLVNSIPGVFGHRGFRLYDPRIIDSITTSGQALMVKAKEYNEKNGFIVTYGDSVGKETRIFIKDSNNEIHQATIESLFLKVDTISQGKEYYNLTDTLLALSLDTTTGKAVWKPIKYIMRHKTNKKIYRVKSSNLSDVVVTEDHSLMGLKPGYNSRKYYKDNNKVFNELSRIKEVSPTNDKCRIITLKYIPRSSIFSKNYPKELYEFMGLFVGDGSYYTKFDSNKKNYYVYLSAGKDTKEIIDKVIIPLKELGWIKNYIISKNGYDITLNGMKICDVLIDFRNCNGKVIPQWLEHESEENICSFLRGLFESDGCIDKTFSIAFGNISQQVIDKVRHLLWHVGISNSLMIEGNENKYNNYTNHTHSMRIHVKSGIEFQKKVGFITATKSKKLIGKKVHNHKKYICSYDFDASTVWHKQIDYNDYVYDIEVEDTHNFFANDFLAHNTDACHTKVIANNIEEALQVGKEIATNLNSMFPVWANELFNVTDATSIKIVFEKIYRRIIYVPKENGKPAKKRYAARLVYEKGKLTDQIYIRGFDYRRSNTAKITKDIQYEVFKKILYADNIESIRADVISYVKDMINKFSTFDLSYIGIPSGFSKPLSLYGGINKVGHKQGIDPEVRGAIYSNQHLHTNFDAGSKVKLIYVKRILDTELPQTDAICFDDEKRLPLLEVDYEKMINATIRKKIERVLLTCGIPWSEIEGQKSLFNF